MSIQTRARVILCPVIAGIVALIAYHWVSTLDALALVLGVC